MSRQIGKIYEDRALTYLSKRGLTFIDKNYFNKTGEIDLIMDDHGIRVFVEVRFRQNSNYGLSLETITPQKQRRIIRTATLYLQEKNLMGKIDCRIDVIAIDQGNPPDIEWIQNAIQAQY